MVKQMADGAYRPHQAACKSDWGLTAVGMQDLLADRVGDHGDAHKAVVHGGHAIRCQMAHFGGASAAHDFGIAQAL